MTWRFLLHRSFWSWAGPTALLCSAFFAWELGMIPGLPVLPRAPVSGGERWFTLGLIFLLSLNAGLVHWRKNCGTCPVGVRRATGIGGAVGAMALLCPACLLLPVSLLGVSVSLAFLAPFLPLLRIIAVLLLLIVTAMLWPRS